MSAMIKEYHMFIRQRLLLVLLGAIVLIASSLTAMAEESGRFTMSPTEGGFLRLDTSNGVVSFCRKNNEGEWTCNVVSDDRGAQQRKIEALESENRRLNRRLKELEEFADQSLQKFSEDSPDYTFNLPQKEDVDKIMNFVEHILQSIKDMAERLKEDSSSEMTL